VQADDGAGAAFRDPEPLTQRYDGAALAVRGQKFPAEISFEHVDVEGLIGDQLLEPGVLGFELLEPFGLVGFIPPY
jgi:hypothetical protein